jgi:hypothetical protein
MNTRLLTAALAAALLPSCSNAGPFDGKSPAEVAAFIAFGYEGDGTYDTRDGAVTSRKLSGEPFTVTFSLDGGPPMRLYKAAMTSTDNCIFDVEFEPGEAMGMPNSTLRFDFSKLTGAKMNRRGVQFEGATLQCVKADQPGFCKNSNGDTSFTQGRWPFRVNLVDEAHKADAENYGQERITQAIGYFRETICKPKG